MLLEIEAEVEKRLREHAAVVEQQGDQQPADATVSVQERMDGLELHMGQRSLHQGRVRGALVVNESLERRMQSSTAAGGGGTK